MDFRGIQFNSERCFSLGGDDEFVIVNKTKVSISIWQYHKSMPSHCRDHLPR